MARVARNEGENERGHRKQTGFSETAARVPGGVASVNETIEEFESSCCTCVMYTRYGHHFGWHYM